MSTQGKSRIGNDTIDPYPLIAVEAKKILIIKRDIFEELRDRYKAFYRGLRGRSVKRSSNVEATRRPFLKPKMSLPKKNYFLAYEPSNAIAVNECDYRRWCRVNEWFAEFGNSKE